MPTQEITSIASFAAIGAPVCVRQNAAQQAFLQTFYPELKVLPIPGLTQAGLLPAIVSGVCKGGVGPDPELKYSLGGPGIFDSDGFDPTRASSPVQSCLLCTRRSLSHSSSVQSRSAASRSSATCSRSATTGCVACYIAV